MWPKFARSTNERVYPSLHVTPFISSLKPTPVIFDNWLYGKNSKKFCCHSEIPRRFTQAVATQFTRRNFQTTRQRRAISLRRQLIVLCLGCVRTRQCTTPASVVTWRPCTCCWRGKAMSPSRTHTITRRWTWQLTTFIMTLSSLCSAVKGLVL